MEVSPAIIQRVCSSCLMKGDALDRKEIWRKGRDHVGLALPEMQNSTQEDVLPLSGEELELPLERAPAEGRSSFFPARLPPFGVRGWFRGCQCARALTPFPLHSDPWKSPKGSCAPELSPAPPARVRAAPWPGQGDSSRQRSGGATGRIVCIRVGPKCCLPAQAWPPSLSLSQLWI